MTTAAVHAETNPVSAAMASRLAFARSPRRYGLANPIPHPYTATTSRNLSSVR
jgi:hypothetical protein